MVGYRQNVRSHDLIEFSPEITSPRLRQVIADVRLQHPEKGVYGGNGWGNYGARYFNDCARFASGMQWCLRPGGTALIAIANSILQSVLIATDEFLGETAVGSGV